MPKPKKIIFDLAERAKRLSRVHDPATVQLLYYGLFSLRWLAQKDGVAFSKQNVPSLLPTTFLKDRFTSLLSNPSAALQREIVETIAFLRRVDFPALSMVQRDPIVYAYEDFLAVYHGEEKRSKGVYYTPPAVVSYMVDSVHKRLQDDFGLPLGLASTQTWAQVGKRLNCSIPDGYDQHAFVQILDPATGTGTFLKRVIERIHHTMLSVWSSCSSEEKIQKWHHYVRGEGEYHHRGLLSRLHAIEILPTPHLIAHLRIATLLRSGLSLPFSFESQDRLSIWNRNFLDEATRVKGCSVIVGNPPYRVHSTNQSAWIRQQMQAYYREPTGEKLQERNSKSLSDDYVKFIRLGQQRIETLGAGLLAYVTPHGFIDNRTFRGMRSSLLRTFDRIECVDLNGNIKKKSRASDGTMDQNVFNIAQGISVNLFSKGSQGSAPPVQYVELLGLRDEKERRLLSGDFSLETVTPLPPSYNFCAKKHAHSTEYEDGISIGDLFRFRSTGFSSKNDSLCIHLNQSNLNRLLADFRVLPVDELRKRYSTKRKSWSLERAVADVREHDSPSVLRRILFRPFDERYTFFSGRSNGFLGRPRNRLAQHFEREGNLCLLAIKKSRNRIDPWGLVFVSSLLIAESTALSNLDNTYGFPLFCAQDGSLASNLNTEAVERLLSVCKLRYGTKMGMDEHRCDPFDVFHYCYAVLHDRAYREKFKSLLKEDFPRVLRPQNQEYFWQRVRWGKSLVDLHLFRSPSLQEIAVAWDDAKVPWIDTIRYQEHPLGEGRVWCNEHYAIDGVESAVWNFQVGDYRPAQRWLQDRKGARLSKADRIHYQKIVQVIRETLAIMEEIERCGDE